MKLPLSTILLLTVFFCQAQTTLIFQPNSDCTKDAFINNSPVWNGGPGFDVNNYGEREYLRIEAWTANANGSPEHDSRSLIDFPELHEIESCDVIQATLVLYANPNITFANGGQAETNDVDIFRVIEPWEELEVTWLSQTDIDETIKAEIPQNNDYDSIEVDVTELVTNMINIDNSFGFLLKQKNEDPYGSMNFASSQYPDPTKAPKLILEANNIVFAEPVTEIFPSPDTTLCFNQPLILSVADPTATSYEWYDGSSGSAVGITNEGSYWVKINYANCNELIDTLNVFFTDENLIQGIFFDTLLTFCENSSFNSFGITDPQVQTFEWSTGSDESTIEITEPGTYWLNMYYFGCDVYTDTINVVFENCNCEIKFPNAFTPDGDNLNDIFSPVVEEADCFEEYDLTIFNRWGNKVFTSTNPENGWNGKYDSKNAISDVYVYILKYKLVGDYEEKVENGDITLIR